MQVSRTHGPSPGRGTLLHHRRSAPPRRRRQQRMRSHNERRTAHISPARSVFGSARSIARVDYATAWGATLTTRCLERCTSKADKPRLKLVTPSRLRKRAASPQREVPQTGCIPSRGIKLAGTRARAAAFATNTTSARRSTLSGYCTWLAASCRSGLSQAVDAP